jgi:hypothetical protein
VRCVKVPWGRMPLPLRHLGWLEASRAIAVRNSRHDSRQVLSMRSRVSGTPSSGQCTEHVEGPNRGLETAKPGVVGRLFRAGGRDRQKLFSTFRKSRGCHSAGRVEGVFGHCLGAASFLCCMWMQSTMGGGSTASVSWSQVGCGVPFVVVSQRPIAILLLGREVRACISP